MRLGAPAAPDTDPQAMVGPCPRPGTIPMDLSSVMVTSLGGWSRLGRDEAALPFPGFPCPPRDGDGQQGGLGVCRLGLVLIAANPRR